MTNVTITLSAEYAAMALADLRRLSETGRVDPTLWTGALAVVARRLTDAIGTPSPSVARVVEAEAERVVDCTDPCESYNAVDTSGPKGQEKPQAPRGSGYDHRGSLWHSLPSDARRDAVRAHAGQLFRSGTHTPVKAWDAALREDFVSKSDFPSEDSFSLCVPVMGGEVHLTSDKPEGGYPPVPHCRTMDRNNRGTSYRFVEHGDVTCGKCLTYRARRQERRDRIVNG